MPKVDNPWKTLSGKLVYENQWIRVDEYDVLTPKGNPGIYGKVSFKGKAAAIIPIDEAGNTWLVGQFRYTLDEYSWEVPMGAVPQEETYEAGALRELKEETGLTANKIDYLCKIHTSNSVTDEVGLIFTAGELKEGSPEFDETEDIKIWKLPLTEAIRMVEEGKITDSLSVIGLLKVARMRGL